MQMSCVRPCHNLADPHPQLEEGRGLGVGSWLKQLQSLMKYKDFICTKMNDIPGYGSERCATCVVLVELVF